MRNYYISFHELSEIYSISSKKVEAILGKYKIDTFKTTRGVRVCLKDFHKIYTSKYNPTLFSFEEKKELIKKVDYRLKFGDYKNLLINLFPTPLKSTSITSKR